MYPLPALQILRGTDAIDVVTAPVVQVSFNLQVSLDDFFDPQHLVSNMAFVLGLPLESIRLVDVVSEDINLPAGRRRRATGMSKKVVTVEIGDPATNLTSMQPPPVSQQIVSGNVDAKKDDVDLDANSTVSNLCCSLCAFELCQHYFCCLPLVGKSLWRVKVLLTPSFSGSTVLL